MKIEVGKRYIRRDGVISGVIKFNTGCHWLSIETGCQTCGRRFMCDSMFIDTNSGRTYSKNGRFFIDQTFYVDLLVEVV